MIILFPLWEHWVSLATTNEPELAVSPLFGLWHNIDTIRSMKNNSTEMKNSDLNYFKILIGSIYVLLTVLIIVALTL